MRERVISALTLAIPTATPLSIKPFQHSFVIPAIMTAPASGSTALIRSLRIKTSSLNRLQKDLKAYSAETTSAQQSVEKWRNTEEKDRDENWEWNVKNAEKVVKDCEQMVPLTQERVHTALEDLKDLVVRKPINLHIPCSTYPCLSQDTLKAEGDEEVLQSSEYELACKALQTESSDTQ
ncbi:hypothetical protein QFC19_007624 [Naganishia cerealis]|uniref:Uncharacterized protein n=1 Tax=Naganishia cerealis TaxID=610337 RepID=A0ACC2V7N3_9TREE|nr:hypothetical protein QFC19_007624 [Naganishia cerealis]